MLLFWDIQEPENVPLSHVCADQAVISRKIVPAFSRGREEKVSSPSPVISQTSVTEEE